MDDLYFVESDGRVFSVKKYGIQSLPSKKEVSFDILVEHEFELCGDIRVFFCRPVGCVNTESWQVKKRLLYNISADDILRGAVLRTLPNLYAGVIVPKEDNKDEILLVMPAVGLSADFWTLPGGFLEYREPPEIAAVRETKEETGLGIVVNKILGVFTRCCGKSGRFSYGFAYSANKIEGILVPKKGEIKDAKYFSHSQIKSMPNIVDDFALFAVEKFIEQK